MHFEELIEMGEDDIDSLISYLLKENEAEGVLFSDLERQVRAWFDDFRRG